MQVRNLTIRNVRQFAVRELRFYPGFNILVGKNGAGKTTILRCLSLVLGLGRRETRRRDLDDEDIRSDELSASITAELSDEDERAQRVTYEKRVWARAHRSRVPKDWLILSYSCNESTCSSFAGRKIRSYGAAPTRDDLRRREEYLFRSEMEGYRLGPAGPSFGDIRKIREFVGRVLGSFSSGFRRFHWAFEPYDCSIRVIGENVDPGKFRDRVRRSIMREIVETDRVLRVSLPWPDRKEVIVDSKGVTRGESGEIAAPPFRPISDGIRKADLSSDEMSLLDKCEILIRLTPRIVIDSNSGPLRLHQLSDGEQRLFSLFVDIARELSISNPDKSISAGSAIILIDEIDVHLHPTWQRQIVPALEDLFPRCQFIATTHSPFVIQAVDRRKVHSLEQESLVAVDNGNSIEDIIEDVQGVVMPQRSHRAERLSIAAEKYFAFLKRSETSGSEFASAEKEYRLASEPFASDPAVSALLRVELLEARNR